ncbi:hypothetical protein BCR32DRAFT_270163 [Anaeromyces robustus]|uniref:Uncharacterized protein n=1 Tax=Anaeromyces robustus TaxID=1754192 RepID=A0A1Y1WY14_9FUNG|nr:hypothetical protein BCR32DRAFT_270163 [Anaeromyces robustus]|eukprot:ORX78275.1 hypothetical protein BCR32DRAFT_270163 [Anaeromyces robustus]
MRILKVLSFIVLIASSYGAAIKEDTKVPEASTPAPQGSASPQMTDEEYMEKESQLKLKLIGGPVKCEYNEKDEDIKYDINSDNVIDCKGNTCTVKGKGGVTATQGLVTITNSGNYIVQGDLQGQILVNANEKDYIHLILNNANIVSNQGPAINGVQANKISLTLVGDNSLVDSLNYSTGEKDPDACLFTKTDFSINGDGKLDITGNFGNAIHCTKDLKFVNGNINILSAKEKGIQAKNSVCVKDANLNINSTNSAIKVTRQDKPEKGYVTFDNGNVTITTENDAIHAETHFTLNGGYVDIKKCLEGVEAQMIDILGGELHINAIDDGINASKVQKKSEKLHPPMPAPGDMDPNSPPPPPPEFPYERDGNIYINIVGGKTFITVHNPDGENDGIDSNGLVYTGGDAELYVDIFNGELFGPIGAVDAAGDNSIVPGATFVAITGDMDESIFMRPPPGGNDGSNDDKKEGEGKGEGKGNDDNNKKPTDNEKEAEDKNKPASPKSKREGGKQTEQTKFYQPYIKTNFTLQDVGSNLLIKNQKGETIIDYTPGNSFSHIAVSTPKIIAGETYIVNAGNVTQNIVAEKGEDNPPKSPATFLSGSIMNSFNFITTLLSIIFVTMIYL